MQREEWDSPRRTRLFLAAALLVGVGGTLYEGRLGIPDVPSWDVPQSVDVKSVPSGDASGFIKETPGGEAAPGASSAKPPNRSVPAATDEEERLRDAVASFQSGAVNPSSAHTAAFAAARSPRPAVPAAIPAAAAPPAHSANSSFASAAGAGQGADSRPNASSQPPSAKGVPVDPDSEAPGRVAVVTPRAAAASAVTPAERFFSGADLSGASVARAGLGSDEDSLDAEGPAGAKARAARAKRPRRLRPVLLSKLLGRRALKAPAALPFPKEKPWRRPIPDGAADPRPLPFAAAEAVLPPPACQRSGPHWHAPEPGSALRWFHDGHDWGRSAPEGWAWLERDHGRVWLWPQPKGRPLLLHQDHWWLRSRGLWFLLHDGEPWGAQYLREWGTEGFVHPSGAQMIYSADGTRVGMIEPDAGAILYDAQSGDELGRWPPGALPKRKGPRAPSSLPPLR